MSIRAIFRNGVFTPTERVSLPEGTAVTVEPEVTETALERETRWLKSQTPEEIEAVRQRINAKSRRPRALPEGKALEHVVVGTWPGDETDEELHTALERLA